MKRILLILAILLIFFITVSYYSKKSGVVPQPQITANAPSAELLRVARVIDGDTIVLENGKKVRYIGINTPEVETGACYSREATEENKRLVEGKTVRLVPDVSDKDKYERELRYVYVGDILVNEYIVREGYAKVESIAPDTAFSKSFLAAQQDARDNKRGLWSSCPI